MTALEVRQTGTGKDSSEDKALTFSSDFSPSTQLTGPLPRPRPDVCYSVLAVGRLSVFHNEHRLLSRFLLSIRITHYARKVGVS